MFPPGSVQLGIPVGADRVAIEPDEPGLRAAGIPYKSPDWAASKKSYRDGMKRSKERCWHCAMVGTPIANPADPVEVGHVARSFDSCLVCTVHAHDAKSGKELARFRTA